MKKLLLIFTLLFSTLIFSSPSYGKWTKVDKVDGTDIYVDFNNIRKHDGYIYWWVLSDWRKPIETGVVSSETYNQGDCKLFRFKYLSAYFHKEPMGRSIGDAQEPPPEFQSWIYPPPKTQYARVLEMVCSWIYPPPNTSEPIIRKNSKRSLQPLNW